MIQRVQSIYLLLVTILMSFLLIWPYAEVTQADAQVLLFRAHHITQQAADQVVTVYKTTVPLVALVLITGIISFVIIFLYNRRILQMRIILINMILLVGMIALMAYYYTGVQKGIGSAVSSIRIGMAFPVLSLVFSTMAIRAIRHDELLVKSYDRIR